MTATRVGPHVGERDLLGRSLLHQQLARIGVEDERGKRSV